MLFLDSRRPLITRREVAMRITRSIVPVFVMSSVLAAAPAKDDEDLIQGTWKIKSETIGGKDRSTEDRQCIVTIAGDKFITKVGDDTQQEGTFKLDTTTKPKSIHLRVNGKLRRGIYKLDGDTLTICGSTGEDPPSEFESKDGSEMELYVLKRVKP